VQTTADGAKAFLGWHDAMLGIDCNFQRAADDSQRCQPSLVANITGTYWGDSVCSVPVAYMTQGGCTPTYASKFESPVACSAVGGYPTTYRYHVYGSLVAVTGTSYWTGAGGATGCTMQTIPAGWQFYTFGAEVPPSTFAQGSVVTE
jgi:hypothetical protein